jgi:site-specific DNA recombinase
MSAANKARVTTPAIRCAIYTRKSSEEGLEQEFNSLDAQREAGEAYIASQKAEGWIVLPERYDDGGYSGGNMDRPALGRLLADIESGNVDCVVVYKVDRLSRSLMDFARIMETFETHHVSFVSVTQHFNTTHSMGRLTLNILLSFAQFEREIIGERIRDKKAAMARKGKWFGGTPVLGYDIDRSNGSPKLVINAIEAAKVREIFALYLKRGSLLQVVQELEKRGWPNKAWRTRAGREMGGRPFDKCSVYNLLTNPIYAGKIRHKNELHEGEHKAIVTPDVFTEVQKMLRHNGRSGGAEVRNKYGALLRSLLYCKSCGRTMVHTFTGRGNKRYRYYTCTSAIKNGWGTCPSKSLPAGEVEQVVVEQIRCIGQDSDLLAEVLQQARKHVDDELASIGVQQRDLQHELRRHHTHIRKLAVEEPATSAATARIADLHERVQRCEQRAAELRDRAAELEAERIGEADVAAAFGDFDNVWKCLSPREQAKLLKLLVARVEFDPAESTITITFHETGIKALSEDKREEAAA